MREKRISSLKFLLASAVILNPLNIPAVIQTETDTASTEAVIELIEGVLEPKQDKIEQYTAPLVKAAEKRREQARKKAEAERAAEQARLAALYVPPPPPPVYTAPTPVIATTPGNGYSFGYCTWYVKNRRPDIPNNWGNASNWLYAAQSIGWPTGSVPRAGAIGIQGNHVVYIESVSGNTVTFSDMNGVAGWNRVGTSSAPASSFSYIF